MKFDRAWNGLQLEQKKALAKRIALNYVVVFLLGFIAGHIINNL